jgi:hypothetical protein
MRRTVLRTRWQRRRPECRLCAPGTQPEASLPAAIAPLRPVPRGAEGR